jgi:hypothetical protein
MLTLKEDIRKWDKGLFEPDSFDLAIFKKYKRNRDEQKEKERLELLFPKGRKEYKAQDDKEMLAKHYDERIASLKELCKKHKVKYDIFKRL